MEPGGQRGITVIGFIGSVFSPYYAWSGRLNPLNHCTINVALYGEGGGRWAMTERGARAVTRSPERFVVGPSSMTWDGRSLTVEVRETAVPHLTPLRGTVRVTPSAITPWELPLTPDGAHVWRAFGPAGRIAVDFERPRWRWEGEGYLDGNFGTRALEADFRRWTWGRFPLGDGAAVLYDAERRDGSALAAGFRFDAAGGAVPVALPPAAVLPRTFWRIRRATRADAGHGAAVVRGWLDVPFYARAAVRTTLLGQETIGVHEVLDLDRFRSPAVKALLPFRMPRRAG